MVTVNKKTLYVYVESILLDAFLLSAVCKMFIGQVSLLTFNINAHN